MRPVFVHIPKNGGMTLRHGLRGRIRVASEPKDLCSPQYAAAMAARMREDGEHIGYAHARWRDLSAKLQEPPAFALVRNPWARTASRYFFARQAVRLNQPSGRLYRSITSFDAFLEERHVYGQRPFYHHRAVRGWRPQMEYVIDAAGMLRCAILRTERLAEDVRAYLGFSLPPRPRNVTTGKPADWRAIYTPRTIDIVGEWYHESICYFGFDFDSPATRRLWHGLAP